MRRAFPFALLILALAFSHGAARTWIVDAGGGGDAITIQAGIDSASAGDTVEVRCGTFYEHDIVMKSEVVLTSETRMSDCVTIDAQDLGRVFYCEDLAWSTSIMGFTITGGNATGTHPDGEGGGAYVDDSCDVTFRNCLFTGNNAAGSGGAVAAYGKSQPRIDNCTLVGNHAGAAGGALVFWDCLMPQIYRCTFKSNVATTYGGAIYCGESSSPAVTRTTFINHTAGSQGAAVYSTLGSEPLIEYCIVAFNHGGQAVYASLPGDAPVIACTDIYGNPGGDWVGNIADQDTTYGNFSADPLFCDTTSTYLYVETCSPCLVGQHPRGYDCPWAVGRWEEDCGCGEATVPATWGAVKALYR
jgi:predicted outer membrane repeat protein